jgi:hypothetical protein
VFVCLPAGLFLLIYQATEIKFSLKVSHCETLKKSSLQRGDRTGRIFKNYF